MSSFALAQSTSDIEYLEMLPQSQSSDIAARLNDRSLRDDEPSFNNSEKKSLVNDSNTTEIFGLSLFTTSPTTFAPIDFSPAPLNYVIGPGDEFKVQYFGNQNLGSLIQINREGNIVLPGIGPIQISGLTFNEAQSKIRSTVEASLIGVDVEISLSKIRSIQIFMLGNALNPGAYTVSSLSNVSNLLFFAGGPSEYGSLRNIEIKRNGETVGNFDFYDLLIN